MTSEPPEIEGYRDLTVIGSGGFATVYRGYQERFDRAVAIKVLDVGRISGRVEERFRRECGAMGRLSNHPGIVTVYDSGLTAAGQPYLTMELFAGGSLAQRLEQEGPLPLAEVVDAVTRVAGALDAAHAAGILHRDLKPANLLVSDYGQVCLADFGIATFAAGDGPGLTTDALTPAHAAPEVLEGASPTRAYDIYGLASTAYQLLAGHVAFRRGPDEGHLPFLVRVVGSEVPDLPAGTGSPAVLAVLRAGMAKAPEDRPIDARTFAQMLADAAEASGPADVDLGRRMPLPPLLRPPGGPAPASAAAGGLHADVEADPALGVDPLQPLSPPRPSAGPPDDATIGSRAVRRLPDFPAAPTATPPAAAGPGRPAPGAPPDGGAARPGPPALSHDADETATVLRRRRTVEEQAPPPDRSLPRWVPAAAGAALVLAVLAGVLLFAGDHDDGSATRSSTTLAGGSATTDPGTATTGGGTPAAETEAVSEASVAPGKDSLRVSFFHPEGAKLSYVLRVTDKAGAPAGNGVVNAGAYVPRAEDRATAIITKVDIAKAACVSIVAFDLLGGGVESDAVLVPVGDGTCKKPAA